MDKDITGNVYAIAESTSVLESVHDYKRKAKKCDENDR